MSRAVLLAAAAVALLAGAGATAAAAPVSSGLARARHAPAGLARKQVVLHEDLAASGVYDVTVTLSARRRGAVATQVIIGTVNHAFRTRPRLRSVITAQVNVVGHRLAIRVKTTGWRPAVHVSWKRVGAIAPPATPAPAAPGNAAGPPPPAAPAGPPNPIEAGVNVTTTSGDPFSPAALSAIRASHPAWVRVFAAWDVLEPQQGVYNTYELDSYRAFFASLPAGTQVDVDVVGTPAWAAGGSANPATPPTDDADYASFLAHLANAFQGYVAAWEIWNEESSPVFWNGTAAQFVTLLAAAYPTLKALDPQATVIVGASDPTFLRALYAGGAQGSFDAVAVHTDTACNITSPYVYQYDRGTTTIDQYFFLGFTGIHAIMAAAGDGSKPIYMTEIGWSSTAAECETGAWAGQKLAGVTQAQQATYLQEAYHCLAAPQYSYVKAAMWFQLVNDGDSAAPLANYGLLNADGSPKPAFAAFQQESLGGDQLTGPCG
jgi:hypothetical protein